jgi:hypothetical protein
MGTTDSTTRPEPRVAARIKPVIAATILGLGSLVAGMAPADGATLEPADSVSNEGYYQLTWDAEEPIRLVESMSSDFAAAITLYSGSDSGHVISGKPDGTWYYRLESADGSTVLSDISVITVAHHPLRRAFLFFAIGAIVFFATLGLIFLSNPDKDERA